MDDKPTSFLTGERPTNHSFVSDRLSSTGGKMATSADLFEREETASGCGSTPCLALFGVLLVSGATLVLQLAIGVVAKAGEAARSELPVGLLLRTRL